MARTRDKWVRLSVAWFRDPKILAVSHAARLLFLQAIAWSAEAETDGVIPRSAFGVIRGDLWDSDAEDARTELLGVGLWVPGDNGGVRISRYCSWQQSATEIESRRVQESERKAKWRASRRGERVDNPVDKRGRDASRDASVPLLEPEPEPEALDLARKPDPEPRARRSPSASPAPSGGSSSATPHPSNGFNPLLSPGMWTDPDHNVRDEDDEGLEGGLPPVEEHTPEDVERLREFVARHVEEGRLEQAEHKAAVEEEHLDEVARRRAQRERGKDSNDGSES